MSGRSKSKKRSDSRNRCAPWPKEQEQALRAAVIAHGETALKELAAALSQWGRTEAEIKVHWRATQPLIKGAWTKAEDDLLRKIVTTIGSKCWSKIAEHVPRRNAKQCRERWVNNLDETVSKEAWSPAEDKVLIDTQRKIGNRWSEISKLLPGRPDNAVKNRWYSMKNRQGGIASAAKRVKAAVSMHAKSPRKRKMSGSTSAPLSVTTAPSRSSIDARAAMELRKAANALSSKAPAAGGDISGPLMSQGLKGGQGFKQFGSISALPPAPPRSAAGFGVKSEPTAGFLLGRGMTDPADDPLDVLSHLSAPTNAFLGGMKPVDLGVPGFSGSTSPLFDDADPGFEEFDALGGIDAPEPFMGAGGHFGSHMGLHMGGGMASSDVDELMMASAPAADGASFEAVQSVHEGVVMTHQASSIAADASAIGQTNAGYSSYKGSSAVRHDSPTLFHEFMDDIAMLADMPDVGHIEGAMSPLGSPGADLDFDDDLDLMMGDSPNAEQLAYAYPTSFVAIPGATIA